VRLNGAFTDTCHTPASRLRLRASRCIPKVVSGGWCYLCVTLMHPPPRDDRLETLKEMAHPARFELTTSAFGGARSVAVSPKHINAFRWTLQQP